MREEGGRGWRDAEVRGRKEGWREGEVRERKEGDTREKESYKKSKREKWSDGEGEKEM